MFKIPNKSFKALHEFLTTNQHIVFRYIIKKVKFGIVNNLDSVELFEFSSDTHRHIATVKEKDYEQILENAIKVFSKVEDYETADKAQQIITLYRNKYINKLLNDINNEG
jgi:hypothetical protein